MKKLMTAIAAITLAGYVGAQSIQSQNIVGYATVDLTPGKQVLTGAMFQQVGGVDLDLSRLNMISTVADAGSMLWWWDMDTRQYTMVYWVEIYDEEENELGYDGWGDGESWVAIPKTISAGQAFWIKPDDGTVTPQLRIAGELITSSSNVDAIGIAAVAGKQDLFCNPMPADLTLEDIALTGGPADAGSMLWWWDMNTRLYTMVYWVELYDEEENELGYDGWGDGESWVAIPKEFTFGQGFWVKPDDGAVDPVLYFTNPLAVAGE